MWSLCSLLPLPAALRDARRSQGVVHRHGEEVGLTVPEDMYELTHLFGFA